MKYNIVCSVRTRAGCDLFLIIQQITVEGHLENGEEYFSAAPFLEKNISQPVVNTAVFLSTPCTTAAARLNRAEQQICGLGSRRNPQLSLTSTWFFHPPGTPSQCQWPRFSGVVVFADKEPLLKDGLQRPRLPEPKAALGGQDEPLGRRLLGGKQCAGCRHQWQGGRVH